MKISGIDAIHLRVEDPNIGLFDGSYDTCVIRVETDVGFTGIGEVESLSPAIQAIVYAPPAHSKARGLRELLLGRDPSDPEELWNLMYKSTSYVGRRGLMMHAIGGVDIALWDLKGQIENRPVSDLLGGRLRERIEAYGTIYPIAADEDGVARQVEDAITRLRLRNVKLVADPWWLDDLAHTSARQREDADRCGALLRNGRGRTAADPDFRGSRGVLARSAFTA
jgi:L-rhamnonate dehydratase